MTTDLRKIKIELRTTIKSKLVPDQLTQTDPTIKYLLSKKYFIVISKFFLGNIYVCNIQTSESGKRKLAQIEKDEKMIETMNNNILEYGIPVNESETILWLYWRSPEEGNWYDLNFEALTDSYEKIKQINDDYFNYYQSLETTDS